MKTLKTILTILILSFASPALANTPAPETGDIQVDVNGLVCDFCARALEKVFGKQDAVESINVDLDEKIVTIYMKDGQSIEDEKVRQLITDSGYNVEKIRHVE